MSAKRILIFNVNWLGDVLFSTAAIRNIRYNFPDSFIACVIPSRCYPVLEGNPYLNEIIVFDERKEQKSMLAKLKFIRALKEKEFDTAFLFHRSFTRALILRLAGIPERIGYYTKRRGFLLTQNIRPPEKDKLHRIDYYLNIIAQAGLKVKDRFTDFTVTENDEAFVDKFLKEQAIAKTDFLVGINPAGNWNPKRWPREHYAVLADRLIKEFSANIIITGGPLDIPLAKKIQGLMRAKAISACGVFNLKQLGALCKRLDLFISADSGPLHIANSVGAKRIIALFGPTHQGITGPFPSNNVTFISGSEYVDCKIPCYVPGCSNNRCMRLISPEDVIKEISKFVI